ncbi:MAG TPA: HAMP domain-containing sensor histidine kinase [Solirubrobacterales bacterium]|nr:HAMP domain-containing sensor histidine kinase [Solirubrobacterales bacterium]
MTEAADTHAGGRRPRSLSLNRFTGDVRTRILASYVALLLLATVASTLIVRQVLLVRMDDRIEEDLTQEVQEFRRLAGGLDPRTGAPFGTDVQRIFRVYLDRNVPGEGEELITVPARGRVRYRQSERADAFVGVEPHLSRWRTLLETERGDIDTPAGEAHYVAVPVVEGPRPLGAFVVAQFPEVEREEVNEAVLIVALTGAGVLVVGTLAAFFAAGRVLAPLNELRDAARSVSGAEMRRRIDVEGSGEIAELGHAFNRMLDRLESAFSSQREFLRDAGHELRTPIAVVRGHLELLAEGRLEDEGDRRETIALVTGELDRMSRFVDDLLLLAKHDQPEFLELETIELSGLCDELLAKARGLGDRDWRLDRTVRRSVVADRQRITQAVMNLVENAVAHTQSGDEIAIGSDVDGDEAMIWVRDSGPGIAPADQQRVFERFARGRHSRKHHEGSGLGLAIVKAIAEAHGGRVELDSRLGVGTRFTVILPVEGRWVNDNEIGSSG